MTLIRLTCPHGCGDVHLDARATRSHTHNGEHTLAYRCPRCGGQALRTLDERALAVCVVAGVAHAHTAPAQHTGSSSSHLLDRDALEELEATLRVLEGIDTVADLLDTFG